MKANMRRSSNQKFVVWKFRWTRSRQGDSWLRNYAAHRLRVDRLTLTFSWITWLATLLRSMASATNIPHNLYLFARVRSCHSLTGLSTAWLAHELRCHEQ